MSHKNDADPVWAYNDLVDTRSIPNVYVQRFQDWSNRVPESWRMLAA
jgi:hypothetical protein